MSGEGWVAVAARCCALTFSILGFRTVAFTWTAAALTWAMVLL